MKVEPEEEGQPNMDAYVLWKFSLCNHCPKLYGAGRVQEGKYNFVVMQLWGRNFTELRRQCRLQSPRMSLSTVLRLVFQAIRAIETLHNIGFLHRDVKPSNFAMGSRKNDERTLYILDFGLARYFMTKHGKLRSPRAQCGFRGTVRYASTNAHDLVDLSRRDDLWSLFYAYFELLIGELPWPNTADRQKTGEEKRRNTPESLCRWIPKETTVFVRLVRRLRYEDGPQYDAIVSALLVCIKRFSIPMDDPIDWQDADCKAVRHWT